MKRNIWWSDTYWDPVAFCQLETTLKILDILPSFPHYEAIFKLKTLTSEHAGLALTVSPPLPLPLQQLASKTTIILSDLSPPSARDQSRLYHLSTLSDLISHVCAPLHTRVCSFSNFWMQEFSASHPSLAPPLTPLCHRALTAEQWPSPGVAIIEKRDGWLLV